MWAMMNHNTFGQNVTNSRDMELALALNKLLSERTVKQEVIVYTGYTFVTQTYIKG